MSNQHDYQICPVCRTQKRFRRRDGSGFAVGGECMCGTQLIWCADELMAAMDTLQRQRPSWAYWAGKQGRPLAINVAVLR